MPKFRKKPIVIEAFQWDGVHAKALADWAAKADFESRKRRGQVVKDVKLPIELVTEPRGYRVEVFTEEGVMIASPGDWIICGVKGEFYPCKPDIFAATYDPAE